MNEQSTINVARAELAKKIEYAMNNPFSLSVLDPQSNHSLFQWTEQRRKIIDRYKQSKNIEEKVHLLDLFAECNSKIRLILGI